MTSLPCRIGAPAYIHPDVGILDNVHWLKDKVDDIELIIPDSGHRCSPAQKEIAELKELGTAWDLTYTIHLPLGDELGSPDDSVRREAADNVNACIDRLSRLAPYGYILHLNLPEKEKDIAGWKDRTAESLRQIAARQYAWDISVENLGYPFGHIADMVLGNGFSVCVDIGHLAVSGADPWGHLAKYLDKTRVVHLHGVNGRKDHVSLRYLDPALTGRLTGLLRERGYKGVLTLEMFSEADLEESLGFLDGA